MTPVWAVYRERVRRRWALVVLLAVVVAAVSAGTLLLAAPTWTGRAALAIVSQNRSPDQDAVLGRGYVDLFNQESLQAEYAARLGLDPGVTFSARLASGTPVLYVEATAPNPDEASRAASLLAVALRDNVRNNLTGGRVQAVGDLTTQLADAQARLATLSPNSPARGPLNDQISTLQTQLTTLQANTTNQLSDLQLDAGVTEDQKPISRTVALSALGGALLGVLAAILLGAAGTRLGSPTEIRARLGRDVLADLDPRDPEATERALARVLAHPDLAGARIAVAAAGTGPAAADDARGRAWVAGSLARLATRQASRVLLLRADVAGDAREDGAGEVPGVSDLLARPGDPDLDGVLRRDRRGVLEVPPGPRRLDVHAALTRDRASDLLAAAHEVAALVVVDAPAVAEAGDPGTIVGAVAGATLLVLTPRTRSQDALRARDALTATGAAVLGVVTVSEGPVPPTTDEATPDVGDGRAEPPPGTRPVRMSVRPAAHALATDHPPTARPAP